MPKTIEQWQVSQQAEEARRRQQEEEARRQQEEQARRQQEAEEACDTWACMRITVFVGVSYRLFNLGFRFRFRGVCGFGI